MSLDLLLRALQPYHVVDPPMTKVRIGAPGDGGYVLFDEICAESDQLMSFGIGDDVGFELDFLARYNVESAFLYDPTVDGPPVTHPRFYFYKDPASAGLGRIHPNATVKMDIEWDEWNLLDHWEPTCAQLVMEAHLLSCAAPTGYSPYFRAVYDRLQEDLYTRYTRCLSRLAASHYLCHIHVNNSLPPVWAQRVWLPPLWELTWVRKDLVKVEPARFSDFPSVMVDRPNKTDRPDYPIAYLEQVHVD